MKRFILAAAIVCCTSISVFTQSIKIGYINSLELVSKMPEAKVADSTIMVLASQLDAQYKGYITEAQLLYSKLQDSTLTEVALEALQQDFLRAQQRIQEYEETSQEKINQKKADMYQTILEKATTAVKEVAKENGYTHVFDSSTGAIVHAPDGDDILSLVLKKLGIK
ncbi:MAG: OmpH family outer membrane protein [Chitinophagales bacterium]